MPGKAGCGYTDTFLREDVVPICRHIALAASGSGDDNLVIREIRVRAGSRHAAVSHESVSVISLGNGSKIHRDLVLVNRAISRYRGDRSSIAVHELIVACRARVVGRKAQGIVDRPCPCILVIIAGCRRIGCTIIHQTTQGNEGIP